MHTHIIEFGIVLLVIYPPLAFGAVSAGSTALIELVAGVLVLVWLAEIFSQRRSSSKHPVPQGQYALQYKTPAFTIPLALFFGLTLFQLLPLPSGIIQRLSPAMYQVYADAATTLHAALPAFLPHTVYAQATEMELYRLIAYIAVFFLIINHYRSPRRIKRLIYVILAVGMFEALYGLFEYFSGHHAIFFHQKQTSLTVSGTFVNKNHFAGYMEMVIPLTFGVLLALLEERGTSSSKTFVRFVDDKYMKALLVSFLLFILIGAELLSGSRGGLISFLGGMSCLVVLASRRRLLRRWTVVILVLLLLAGAMAVLLGYDLLIERLQALVQLENEQSFQYRRQVWQDTLGIVADFPLLGTGLGTFSHIFPTYQRFPSNLSFFYAENDYLQLLAETGIVGGSLTLCIVALFFITTLRAWTHRHSRWAIVTTAGGISSLVSLLIHSSIDFNLHIPSNALLFTIIAALTTAAAHSHRRASTS